MTYQFQLSDDPAFPAPTLLDLVLGVTNYTSAPLPSQTYYWRVFETNDEYFDYYRDYHAFWKLYGLGLPDSVLKKLYYVNALKLTAAIPRSGFPKQ